MVSTFKYTDFHIRTGILDYLREGFPWPAQPSKHTESNLFTHRCKYTDGTGVSYYLRGIAVSRSTYLNVVTVCYRIIFSQHILIK